MSIFNYYYAMLDPNKIFGMIGRCGGGYNTVWEDWSSEGRTAREHITREYEEGLDKICGHYSKLEKSIVEEGFRNPLIITCGTPRRRKLTHLPPEMRSTPTHEWLLMEGTTGGSRLWVAQKYNIPVPCIVNDFTGKFNAGVKIKSVQQAKLYYKDPPLNLTFSPRLGIVEAWDNTKTGYHLGPEWREDIIIRQRAPLWVSIMNKYGYYVDGLQPNVQAILRSAGVIQPENLKNRFNSR